MIKAVIFDMDGLLIDSEPLWWEAEIEIAKTVGINLTKEQTLETTGLKVDKIVEHWFHKKPWTSPPREEVEDALVRDLIARVEKRGAPMPGAAEILELMKKKKVKMALASSSLMPIIDAATKKLGINRRITEQSESQARSEEGAYREYETDERHRLRFRGRAWRRECKPFGVLAVVGGGASEVEWHLAVDLRASAASQIEILDSGTPKTRASFAVRSRVVGADRLHSALAEEEHPLRLAVGIAWLVQDQHQGEPTLGPQPAQEREELVPPAQIVRVPRKNVSVIRNVESNRTPRVARPQVGQGAQGS